MFVLQNLCIGAVIATAWTLSAASDIHDNQYGQQEYGDIARWLQQKSSWIVAFSLYFSYCLSQYYDIDSDALLSNYYWTHAHYYWIICSK